MRVDEDICLGWLVNDIVIWFELINGAIIDGGDSSGFDIEIYMVVLFARWGIGLVNVLDILIYVLVVRNGLSGGVWLFNDNLNWLMIGDVDGLLGIMSGLDVFIDFDYLVDSDIEIMNCGVL